MILKLQQQEEEEVNLETSTSSKLATTQKREVITTPRYCAGGCGHSPDLGHKGCRNGTLDRPWRWGLTDGLAYYHPTSETSPDGSGVAVVEEETFFNIGTSGFLSPPEGPWTRPGGAPTKKRFLVKVTTQKARPPEWIWRISSDILRYALQLDLFCSWQYRRRQRRRLQKQIKNMSLWWEQAHTETHCSCGFSKWEVPPFAINHDFVVKCERCRDRLTVRVGMIFFRGRAMRPRWGTIAQQLDAETKVLSVSDPDTDYV